jgi:type I restriction enzyme M protein
LDQTTHNKIVSFIWGTADDILRDLFKRVNTRRDPAHVRNPSNGRSIGTKQEGGTGYQKVLDEARITEQRAALCDAAGQPSTTHRNLHYEI